MHVFHLPSYAGEMEHLSGFGIFPLLRVLVSFLYGQCGELPGRYRSKILQLILDSAKIMQYHSGKRSHALQQPTVVIC